MSDITWSSSRVSCFNSCPLKYKLHYIEKWEPEIPLGNDLAARKGSVFHQTVENYKSGDKLRQLKYFLLKNAKELNVDLTQFPLENGINKFFKFWENEIFPKEKDGFKIYQERTLYGKIKDQNFMGIIDLMADNGSTIEIVDYKTGKKPSPDSYKNQLFLYAYLAGLEKKWSFEEIADKISLKLFFPLYEVDGSIEEQMKKSLIEIKYTAKDIEDSIKGFYEDNLNKIAKMDWSKLIEGTMSYECSWCQYLAAPTIGNFEGCPITIEAGLMQPIKNVKYIRKKS